MELGTEEKKSLKYRIRQMCFYLLMAMDSKENETSNHSWL